MKLILPLAPVDRLIRKSGAKRVSDSAKLALAEVLEDFSEKVAVKAMRLAMHAGRKTITAADIKLAMKEFNNS